MMQVNSKGDLEMKKLSILSLALAAFVSVAPQQAFAQNCGPMIKTAENQLMRMSENKSGDKYAVDGPGWRMDLKAARALLDEAKDSLREGQEISCELQVTEALKRLGNGLWGG